MLPGRKLALETDLAAVVRVPTAADPWRILVSACLVGQPVAVDGTSYGFVASTWEWLFGSDLARPVPFCPEDFGIGTPRSMPDLHRGDGFAVLRGEAEVRGPDGEDFTAGMLRGARAMRGTARRERVDFALLTDRSGACGTQVVSLGNRAVAPVRYVRGFGVAAAVLLEDGVDVVSHRDHRTLARLRAMIEPGFVVDPALVDHHAHPWVVEHLGPHDERPPHPKG